MDFSRRRFLEMSAAASAALLLSRTARSETAVHPTGRNLVIVWVNGGWDPTFVFDPKPGMATVDTPPGELQEFGNLPVWTSDMRPAVAGFFQVWGGMTSVVNGINVPSLAHPPCRLRVLTGFRDLGRPDVAAIAAHTLNPELPLPYLVLGDAGFVGPLGASVGRVGRSNQLKALLDVSEAYPPPAGQFNGVIQPNAAEAEFIRQYVLANAERERATRGARGYNQARVNDFVSALTRSDQLVTKKDIMKSGRKQLTFQEQIEVGVDALQHGLSRSVMLDGRTNWDTHVNNHVQGDYFNDLFIALDSLALELAARPGAGTGSTLLDETVVIALSEMGRTPLINGADGKDHWPVTSALLFGAGVAGQRVVGATDDFLLARKMNMGTGLPDAGGEALYPENLLAGLLELVGVDPSAQYPGITPLRGFHA
jgi:hypothetical protein